MRPRIRLLIISRWLGTFPSLGYALIYLFLIPLFALVFYNLPKHFYHSTIQHESPVSTSFGNIRKNLADLTVGDFRTANRKGKFFRAAEVKPWEVDINKFDNLKLENNNVSFDLIIKIYQDYQIKPDERLNIPDPGAFPLNVSFDLTRTLPSSIGSHETKSLKLDFKSESELLKDNELRWRIQEALFPNAHHDGNYVGLEIPTKLMEKMRDYASGSSGFGSSVEGNFVRMLYLSAVTITTLGYGDIVPLTTTTRLLISLESILGIVLIGLFLNSLSYERAAMEEIMRKLNRLEAGHKRRLKRQEALKNGARQRDSSKVGVSQEVED